MMVEPAAISANLQCYMHIHLQINYLYLHVVDRKNSSEDGMHES